MSVLEWGEDIREVVLGRRFGQELWRELLSLALLLLVVELWIARSPQFVRGTPAPTPEQQTSSG